MYTSFMISMVPLNLFAILSTLVLRAGIAGFTKQLLKCANKMLIYSLSYEL